MSEQEKLKKLRNATLAFKARKFLEVASSIASDVIMLRKNPGVQDIAAMGIRSLGAIINRVGSGMESYFDDWSDELSNHPFVNMLMDIIAQHPTRQIGGIDTYAIMITDLYGEEIGWIRTELPIFKADDHDQPSLPDDRDWFCGPWSKHERREHVNAALGRAIWESVGIKHVVLSMSHGSDDDDRIRILPDDSMNVDVYDSELAEQIYGELRLFYDAGINRSEMLIGPPGTGKTTIMKMCARRFDKYTLRIDIHELASMSISYVIMAVKLLRPDVLVIDDFDRLQGGHTHMLSALEDIMRHVKIVLISVNDITLIDPAVIRPGRIDKIREIKAMDRRVIDELLGSYDVPNDVRKMMASWPVAYITEFKKRAHVLGTEAAMTELIELRYRAERLNSGDRGTGFPSRDEMLASFEIDGVETSN